MFSPYTFRVIPVFFPFQYSRDLSTIYIYISIANLNLMMQYEMHYIYIFMNISISSTPTSFSRTGQLIYIQSSRICHQDQVVAYSRRSTNQDVVNCTKHTKTLTDNINIVRWCSSSISMPVLCVLLIILPSSPYEYMYILANARKLPTKPTFDTV